MSAGAPLRIRRATADDAELVLRFIRELAEYEREPDSVETNADMLRAQLASDRPPFECLIAEGDSTALGFALFFQNYSTWRGRPGIWLEDLFVSPKHRGRGVGKALLVEVARIACGRDAGRLDWAVLDWNQPAIDFYRSLGAEALGDWTLFRLTGESLDRLAQRQSEKAVR